MKMLLLPVRTEGVGPVEIRKVRFGLSQWQMSMLVMICDVD